MKPATLIRLTVSLVLVIFASPGLAGDWQEFPVSSSFDDQEKPDVHGNKIVWQELIEFEGTWDWDVNCAELTDEEIFFFPVSYWVGSDQSNPVIYENKVAWQDDYWGDWDIRVAGVADPYDVLEYPVAESFDNEVQPAISGDTVIWQSETMVIDEGTGEVILSHWDIWGAETPDPNYRYDYVITLFEDDVSHQQTPAIFRNKVVWQDDHLGKWDIFVADIWQKNYPVVNGVSLTEYDQEEASIWGDVVAWQENVDGNWNIRAANISDPEAPVEFTICNAPLSQTNPDVGDNLIVWQDYRNGNWDIYGYNLTTGQEFQITDDGADQINPAVSGNLVVWQDYRYEYPQIYAVELFGPEVARCDVKPAGDTNGDCRTDLADLATIGQTWLICGLDIAEACWN